MKNVLHNKLFQIISTAVIGIVFYIFIGVNVVAICMFTFIAALIIPSESTNIYVREPYQMEETLEKFFFSRCGVQTEVTVDPATISRGSVFQVANSTDGSESEVVSFTTNNFISGDAEIHLYKNVDSDEVIKINSVAIEKFEC